jgi:hypothetical protein
MREQPAPKISDITLQIMRDWVLVSAQPGAITDCPYSVMLIA